MNQYQHYCLEDFVLDAKFQSWVRYQQANEEDFWQSVIHNYPNLTEDINGAKTFLRSVYKRYETQLSDNELQFEIRKLVEKARQDKNLTLKGKPAVPETSHPYFLRTKSIVWMSRAAVAIFILGLGLWFWKIRPQSAYDKMTGGLSLTEKYNDTSEKQSLTLSDGTLIVLEPGSRISYPQTFSGDRREVYLSGIAFFKVSKDAKHPFFVYASELVTKVLGTSFIIKAIEKEKESTVEVKEGKVSVFRNPEVRNPGNLPGKVSGGLVLTANQKIVFEKESTQMTKTLSDSPEIVSSSKLNPTFEYKNTPVSEVFYSLENAYQVDIIFDEELLKDCPLTASLDNQTLYEKLSIICEAIGAQYELLDGQIVVQSKGCKN